VGMHPLMAWAEADLNHDGVLTAVEDDRSYLSAVELQKKPLAAPGKMTETEFRAFCEAEVFKDIASPPYTMRQRRWHKGQMNPGSTDFLEALATVAPVGGCEAGQIRLRVLLPLQHAEAASGHV